MRALSYVRGRSQLAATIERTEQGVAMTQSGLAAGSVAALVTQARAGSQEAWDALVERYLPLVSGVIARHRLFGADADDVNQTVWLRLVEHLDDLREPAALPGWVATTTRNECLRVIRGTQRMLPVDPQESSALDRGVLDESFEEALVTQLRHQALRDALADLPAPRRELLVLLVAEPPVPYADISRRLGIPVGSIGPTRARLLDQLRRHPALQAMTQDDDAITRRR